MIMKQTIKMLSLLFLAALLAISCKKDDNGGDPDPIVEDGIYLIGEASPFATAELAGMLHVTENEAADPKAIRATLYEIYAPLTVGTIQLKKVEGKNTVNMGGTLIYTYNGSGVGDQPKTPVRYFTPTEGVSINITEAGMYHVIYDSELQRILVAKANWGIRGDLNSWGFTEFTAINNYTSFGIQNLEINAGKFKFAYGGGWKIGVDDTLATSTVRVNTNFGGSWSGSSTITATLEPGGADYIFTATEKGKYTVGIQWVKGLGFVAGALVKTGSSDQPDYPANMYVIGSFASWEWSSDKVITMTPVNGTPNAFWTITYFTAGTEFKFCPVKEWSGDFGKDGDAVDYVYAKGGANISIATDGVYLLYVDLLTNQIYAGPANVYLTGPASSDPGAWGNDTPADKFTVNGSKLQATTLNAGNLRMYGRCSLSASLDWWKMEFNIFNGKIEYRGNGGDQAAVPVLAGQQVSLDYSNNTGSIQ